MDTLDKIAGTATTTYLVGMECAKRKISSNKKASPKDAQIILNKSPLQGACLPVGMVGVYYSASATTSFTSGIMRFIIPSMPAFNVIIDEGQPLQLPCSIRFTFPSS